MKRFWQIGNISALMFALIMNFLVGTQVLNVPSISDMSDKYATLLTPASYAFSIWLLIYLLLISFVIYQARDLIKPRTTNNLPQKIGPWFIIASICNGLWTYIFVSELVGLSVVMLLTLTLALYILLWRLNIANFVASPTVTFLVWWPLMIYTGWVSVASVVNIASWFEYIGVTPVPLFAIGVLIALAAGLLYLLLRRNVRELLLAAIWGIAAIGVQQISDNATVAISAFAVAGILLAAVAVHGYMNRRQSVAAQLIK